TPRPSLFGDLGGKFEGLVSASEKSEARRRLRELGRNDPCWCGSGKKYKHCHLREDQQEARG
ncbi:MAG: SEC-C metal-binding domain-containing protein, partial [Anaerolineae bacterium]